jgi:hypothetical protein
MFSWALANEIPGVAANPAERVPLLKAKKAGGFPVWTPADIDRFEARHVIGTTARLALALLCYTGARRSDIVLFGRQHVKDGRLHFLMQKGRNRAPLTVGTSAKLKSTHARLSEADSLAARYTSSERNRLKSFPLRQRSGSRWERFRQKSKQHQWPIS